MNEITEFLIDLLKKASRIIKNKPEVHLKGNKGDLVTTFDYEIEKFITQNLNKHFPNFDIYSEEFNSESEVGKNYFTIDPIDGTVNFANNIPLWGIQVACVKNNKVCSAAIYQPATKELAYADADGAFLNGEKLKIKLNDYNKKLIALITSHKKNLLLKDVHYRHFGCACATYVLFVKNCFGGVILKCNDNINKNWDHTPGIYIALKAGAKIVQNGNLYSLAQTKKKAEEILNGSLVTQ